MDGGTSPGPRPAGPLDARYVIVAAWMHGTGQEVDLAATPKPSYLVDHFAASGFNAVKDYWETKVLTPALRTAMKNSGGSLFFDSLELNRNGVQVRSWTPDMLAEFQQRRGYSLVPTWPPSASAPRLRLHRRPSVTGSARTTTRPSPTCSATTTSSRSRAGAPATA